MYIVYKYVAPNGKVYIGQTKNSLAQRAGKNGSKYKENILFYRAILKYGWDFFEKNREILKQNLTQEEANYWEQYYIDKYDSIYQGYNILSGGQNDLAEYNSIPIVCINLLDRTQLTFESITEAARQLNINSGNISQNIKKQIAQVSKYLFVTQEQWDAWSEEEKDKAISSARHGLKKPVICITTGEIFYSLTEAAAKYNLQNSKISNCCKGLRNTTGGKQWMYLDDWEKLTKEQQQSIKQKTYKYLCVETGAIYDTSVQAMEQTGVDQSSIRRCCKGKQKTAGGFHWRYKESEE